ncbi:MAG: hypothetical protein ACR2J3_02815 [Aridibacter sp.]
MKRIIIFVAVFLFCGMFCFGQQTENDLIFHKEFLGNGVQIGNSVAEFKSSGVFINGKQKAAFKTEGGVKFLLARYSDISRSIYVLVTDAASGTCGYTVFTVVTIDESEKVKIYEPSPEGICNGEVPSVKFYMSEKKDYPFLIDVGYELQFNLATGKWKKLSKAKK